MRFAFFAMHIWDIGTDILYIFVATFYNPWLQVLSVIFFLAPFLMVICIAKSKGGTTGYCCCIATLLSLKHDEISKADLYDANEHQAKNHLVFVLLEDFPQLVIQTCNGLLIGSTLSWIEVLSPLTSFISAVFAVHGVLYNELDEKIENPNTMGSMSGFDGNKVAAGPVRSTGNDEVTVQWCEIVKTIIVWTCPLIVIFGGMMAFIIWATQWVDSP